MGLYENENEGIYNQIFTKKKERFRRAETEKVEKEINELEIQLLLTPSENVVEQIENLKNLI